MNRSDGVGESYTRGAQRHDDAASVVRIGDAHTRSQVDGICLRSVGLRRRKRAREAILARLRDGSTPCDGTGPRERIDVFARWIDGGKRE
jgi:hypothetical protein